MSCSWDCPNAKNISCVSGGRLAKRGQILFQAEFVHKIAGVPTQCQADIRAKQTAGLLVFHRFPIGSGRGTAHTANEANPFVPPIQVSAVFGQIWKSQFFTNTNPSNTNPSQHSSCTQVSPSSARLLSLPPKDDYGCQAETLMCSQ